MNLNYLSLNGVYPATRLGKLPESKGVSHYNSLENDFLARISGHYFRKYW